MLAIQAIKTIKTAYSRFNAFLVKKAEYSQLSHLDPYLLEDMGIQLKDGEVISTRKNDVDNTDELVVIEKATPHLTIARNENAEALEPPPRPSQG